MKHIRSAVLSAMLSAGAVMAHADASVPGPTTLQALAGAPVVMDDLNVLLLYPTRTSQRYDPVALTEMTASTLSTDMRRMLDDYSRATNDRQRFERRSLLEFEVQERAQAVSGRRPYLLPLDVELGDFDPKTSQVPLRLSLDTRHQGRDTGKRCLAPAKFQRTDVVVCIVTSSLESGDPIFNAVPVTSSSTAAELKKQLEQGKLRMYARAADAGNPTQVTIAAREQGSQIMWSQPVILTGLVLANADTGAVIAQAQAQLTQGQSQRALQAPVQGMDPVHPSGLATDGAQPTSASPGTRALGQSPVDGDTIASNPAPKPKEEVPSSSGEGPQTPGLDPAGGEGSLPRDLSLRALDRLLAKLSYLVYTSDEQYSAKAADVDELRSTLTRMDAAREKFSMGERSKIATELEEREWKLNRLKEDLVAKQRLPETDMVTLIPTPSPRPGEKTYFEHYRLSNGRHVIAFRGTATLDDLETDMQLAMTPEMLGELAQSFKKKGGFAREAAARWLETKASNQVAKDFTAFQTADELVASFVRNGVNPSKIILTGHSLGGGLAQYAGFRNQVGTIVTFNPSPLNDKLRGMLPAPSGTAPLVRHYISFVPGDQPGEAGTFDPISQSLADVTGLRNPKSLRVLGKKFVVTVCKNREDVDYKWLHQKAQKVVTSLTAGTMAMGNGKYVHAATAVGAVEGATAPDKSTVDNALETKETATNVAAAFNCMRHPFMCSGVAVGGGLASIGARTIADGLWTTYTAHRMQNLYDAMNSAGPATCGAVQSAPAGME